MDRRLRNVIDPFQLRKPLGGLSRAVERLGSASLALVSTSHHIDRVKAASDETTQTIAVQRARILGLDVAERQTEIVKKTKEVSRKGAPNPEALARAWVREAVVQFLGTDTTISYEQMGLSRDQQLAIGQALACELLADFEMSQRIHAPILPELMFRAEERIQGLDASITASDLGLSPDQYQLVMQNSWPSYGPETS